MPGRVAPCRERVRRDTGRAVAFEELPVIVAVVCLSIGFVAGVVATLCATGGTSYRAAGNREAADNRALRVQNQQYLAELRRYREAERLARAG